MADISFSGEIGKYELVAVGTAAAGATLTAGSVTPSGSIRFDGAVITVGDAGIRWRCDGGTPGTASPYGHLLGTTDALTIVGHGNLTRFRAVAEGTVSANMLVSYFR